jgi:hypothetical protein
MKRAMVMMVLAMGCASERDEEEEPVEEYRRYDDELGSSEEELISLGPGPAAPTVIRLRNIANGKCVDAPAAPHVVVVQHRCHGGALQDFEQQPVFVGSVLRSRLYNRHNNTCVTAAGSALRQEPCGVNDVRQAFELRLQGSVSGTPFYDLVSQVPGPLQCVDIPSGLTADSVPLQLFACHGGTNQLFTREL